MLATALKLIKTSTS